jgi:Recombinase zinc beta ribbon domain
MDRLRGEDERSRSTGRGYSGNRVPATLLSGLSVCSECGGPIRIAGGWKPQRCYGCGWRNDRGSTVCENNLLESVSVVDRRVIEEIESLVLDPDARRYTLEHALGIIRERLSTAPDELGELRTRLTRVERELSHLVRAVEFGNPPASLLERIRAREEERVNIQSQIERLTGLTQLPGVDLRKVERIVEENVRGVGDMLRGDLVVARATLKKLVSGRIVFRPTTTESGERTYLLEAGLTLGNLIPRGGHMTENVPDGI